MLLTLTTTHRPATDLGYLLHKNPTRAQSFSLAYGTAHVFYPEVGEDRTTAALLLEVDPVDLVRGRPGSSGEGLMQEYVNDRPYAASSLLSVAIGRVFGSALGGRCSERPELARTPIPLVAFLGALPCRGGEGLLRKLFEPLGYSVQASEHPLDAAFPEWGRSPYWSVTLRAVKRLDELLTHLYVTIPVLDDDKHYWIGDAEVEKLLRHGRGWLSTHPERTLITSRYLKHQRGLTREALERLMADEVEDLDAEPAAAREEEAIEERVGLNEQRIGAVLAVLRQSRARSVLDLGCGEGKLLRALLSEKSFTTLTAMDVSHRSLEIARERLKLDRLPEGQRDRVRLLQGSLTYRDSRLEGHDAAAVVEVIEHLEPERLAAFERVLFECAQPATVVVTTPNAEYNVRFENLAAGAFRHRDHRFEWTRAEMRAWADGVCGRFGYRARFLPVGEEDARLGPPTQMAVFER